jgi:hypothetical protein
MPSNHVSAEHQMPEPASLPLPTPPSGPGGARVDAVLVALVLGFAFLAASFVARNSDLWLHLAAGRLIAGGGYHFGSDPFAYTTADRYWANHAWLFDLGLYLAFGALGGAGLVALKAAAATGTAALMLWAARGRGPVWVSAGCVLLAVLAMSPRLLLQPAVASYLLLAVCLCCLRAGGRALTAVPVLVALWVNVDAWFILGPALVGLFWLGRRIDPASATLPAWPRWLIPASLLACLASPHHVFALVAPMELSPAVWGSDFPKDERLAGVFSPWHREPPRTLSSFLAASPFSVFAVPSHRRPLGAAGGYNLAAWAFFVLLALGLLSFAVNRGAVRSWRAAVWLPFALLAAWQVRLIPFFAVVAGPVAALNLGEVLSRCPCSRPGRALVLVAGLVLGVLAWFGWTNGFYNRERGAGWAVHTDPTLVRAAHGLAVWRESAGAPPDSRVFTAHPDVGHYLAWFRPGERAFLDSRLNLFAHAAADYAALSRGVEPLTDGGGSSWQDVARSHGVAAILLYDPDPARTTGGVRGVAGWEVARIDGAAVLLVPKGAPGSRFDPERLALGGRADLRAAGGVAVELAEPRQWWEMQREHGRIGSWEADAAVVYVRMAEDSGSDSPALPLLAVRSARLATEADPTDSLAWLILGRAYLQLGQRTWEREAGSRLAPLEHVRWLQITAALTQAVLRNPDSIAARESLAVVFLQRRVFDLAHLHTHEVLRLTRRSGPVAGETAEAFGERVARLAALDERLEALVQEAENRFLVRTATLGGDPLARARIAAELGLARKAADVLLTSHADLYGTEGLGELANWLLQTGQFAECRILLDRVGQRDRNALGEYRLPGSPHPGGHQWTYRFRTYDWLDLCQCAGAGNYSGASKAIDRLNEQLREAEEHPHPDLSLAALTRQAALHTAGEAGLGAQPGALATRLWEGSLHQRLADIVGHTRFLSVARGDLTTLAGVLELERGDPAAAAGRFDSALALYAGMKGLAPALPGEPLAMRYHEAIRKAR